MKACVTAENNSNVKQTDKKGNIKYGLTGKEILAALRHLGKAAVFKLRKIEQL